MVIRTTIWAISAAKAHDLVPRSLPPPSPDCNATITVLMRPWKQQTPVGPINNARKCGPTTVISWDEIPSNDPWDSRSRRFYFWSWEKSGRTWKTPCRIQNPKLNGPLSHKWILSVAKEVRFRQVGNSEHHAVFPDGRLEMLRGHASLKSFGWLSVSWDLVPASSSW